MLSIYSAARPDGMCSHSQGLKRFICCYFLFVCVIAPFNLLAFDSYYYWDWSRHLALSYYDGPPLIAYIIRLVTIFSGHNLYGLTFISVVFTALTARVLFKTAALFLSEKACYLSTTLWLTSPLVVQDGLIQVTYDTPMTFFWASSLYYAISYLKKNSNDKLYYLGASLGFLLLSKYTGIVLIVCLLFFIVFTRYIRLFKNIHFYGAIGLIALIFSPVLIWNMQHDWISFHYQMHTHRAQPQHQGLWRLTTTFLTIILPALNLMILPPFLILKRSFSSRLNDTIRLLMVISLGFLGFYLLLSIVANLRLTWLSQYLLSTSLLVGWLLQSLFHQQTTADASPSLITWLRLSPHHIIRFKKLMYGFLGMNTLISVIIMLNTCLHFYPSRNYIYYKLIQQFNIDYPQQPGLVFTSGWLEARILFFLKDKPMIDTLPCDQEQNAYQFWRVSHSAVQMVGLKNILFIDTIDQKKCLSHYFKHCQRQKTTAVFGRNLYVYRCDEDAG